jgi:hypothetical protein
MERNVLLCDMLKFNRTIKFSKPKHKYHMINQILADKGHITLRLPLYHLDVYPTAFIWRHNI